MGDVGKKDGGNGTAWGAIYKAILHSVLLYGRKSWAVTGDILKVLEGFHNWLERQLTGMTVRRTTRGEWYWPPVADVLYTTELWPIKEYIQRRHTTLADKVAYRPIYEICRGAERMPVASRFMRWWDQDVGQEVE